MPYLHRLIAPGGQRSVQTIFGNFTQNCMLSPTEREILRFMLNGYSMPQIAVQLERNIKHHPGA